jgi:Tol biopolymer transport system component
VFDNAGSEPLDPSDLSPTQEIFAVPATGGVPVRLTHDDVGEKQAVYSPDGSRIAVSRGGAGIWVMRADGSHPRRVRGIEGSVFSPRWSPDGAKIAFLTYLDDLRPFVFDPRFATGNQRRSLPLLQLGVIDITSRRFTSLGVLTASDVNAPSWLPSGDAILIDRFTAS